MVLIPRLHPPGPVAPDVVLPANKTDTRCSRDVGIYIRWHVRWFGRQARSWDYDSRHAGEHFDFYSLVFCPSITQFNIQFFEKQKKTLDIPPHDILQLAFASNHSKFRI